jgi:hypothetical protein
MNAILTENIESKTVLINGQLLEVYSDGQVYRFNKKNDKLIVENTASNKLGYNLIWCNRKIIKRHRIIGFAFLGLDIEDSTQQIDHIDGCRINNCVNNLRVVTNQQNSMNRTTAKGYSWNKNSKKYKASIELNNKKIHLGYFKTEDEARAAYLAAKQIHHVIN